MEIPIGAAGALQRYLDAVDAAVPEQLRRATEFVGAAADCVSDATDRR